MKQIRAKEPTTERFDAQAQNRSVRMLLTAARQRLTEAGCDTPRLDAELLLAHGVRRNRSWLLSHPEANVTESEQNSYLELVQRRAAREPVAYLVGRKAFYGLDFKVTPETLIPRPETELLVETAIHVASAAFHPSALAQPQGPPYAVVDVGTGSGCIAVSLAKSLPQLNVTAIDLSDEALKVARQNAAQHEVAGRIQFLAGDLLAPLQAPVDMIVSNPPYVNSSALKAPFTTPEVNHYEPRLALDGGEAGLDVIERLLAQAVDYLKPGGMLLVEIGATQGNVVKKLAQAEFSTASVEIRPDLAGRDRLLVVENRVD